MDLIHRQRKHGSIDQRIHHNLDVEHKETDSVYYQIHQDVDLSHTDVPVFLRTAHSDNVRPARRSPSPQNHSASGACDDSSDDTGRQIILDNRTLGHGHQQQKDTDHRCPEQRFHEKFLPHHPKPHEKQRYIQDIVNCAGNIHPWRKRKLYHTHQEGTDQLRNPHKSPVIQVKRRDQHI